MISVFIYLFIRFISIFNWNRSIGSGNRKISWSRVLELAGRVDRVNIKSLKFLRTMKESTDSCCSEERPTGSCVFVPFPPHFLRLLRRSTSSDRVRSLHSVGTVHASSHSLTGRNSCTWHPYRRLPMAADECWDSQGTSNFSSPWIPHRCEKQVCSRCSPHFGFHSKRRTGGKLLPFRWDPVKCGCFRWPKHADRRTWASACAFQSTERCRNRRRWPKMATACNVWRQIACTFCVKWRHRNLRCCRSSQSGCFWERASRWRGAWPPFRFSSMSLMQTLKEHYNINLIIEFN